MLGVALDGVGLAPAHRRLARVEIARPRGLSRALCPGADAAWLVAGRVRAPRPLTMHAVGRWADGTFRQCVTLNYAWRGEWATAPTPSPVE